jgi:creatinine amidohydrolase/Fe(II)-dependent formamide hydrolase-like protein
MSASPGEAITSSNRLSELSRVEAAERGRAGAVCLLPVGSLEQHGEHLPVGTDSLLVETVSLRAAGLALTEECLPDMGASGVLGDPAAASPAAGERFVDTAAHGLAELLDALASPDTEESRP